LTGASLRVERGRWGILGISKEYVPSVSTATAEITRSDMQLTSSPVQVCKGSYKRFAILQDAAYYGLLKGALEDCSGKAEPTALFISLSSSSENCDYCDRFRLFFGFQ
jgi:hypothetical protein